MKIVKLTHLHHANKTLHIRLASGWQFVYSYDTPVIAVNPNGAVMVTVVHHSRTTSKAINGWLNDNGVKDYDSVDQQVINDLAKDI